MLKKDYPREHRARPMNYTKASKLTPRMKQLLWLLTQGRTNKDIANLLGIQLQTVKNSFRYIFPKIGAEHRVQAAMICIDHPEYIKIEADGIRVNETKTKTKSTGA